MAVTECLAVAIVAAVPPTIVALAEIIMAWRNHTETIRTIISNGSHPHAKGSDE